MRLWIRVLPWFCGALIVGIGLGYYSNASWTFASSQVRYRIDTSPPTEMRVRGIIRLVDSEKKIFVIETKNLYDPRTSFILEVSFAKHVQPQLFAALKAGDRAVVTLVRGEKGGPLSVLKDNVPIKS